MNPLCRNGVILKKVCGLVIIVVLAAGCDLQWARETGQQPVREQASGKPLTTCPLRQIRAKFSQTFPCSYFFCCAHYLPRCIYCSFLPLHSFSLPDLLCEHDWNVSFNVKLHNYDHLLLCCLRSKMMLEKYINCGYLACEFNAEVWAWISCSRHETGWALDERWSVAAMRSRRFVAKLNQILSGCDGPLRHTLEVIGGLFCSTTLVLTLIYLKRYRTGVELILFWFFTNITHSDPFLGLMVYQSHVVFWSPHWSLFIPTTKLRYLR